jgi:ribosomal protein S18 acetylase RimI-like enzyme
VAELKRVWLLEEYRGCGIGARLMNEPLAAAAARGYRRVRLEVATPELQAAALRLYERFGFVAIERYREGPCTLSLERALEGETMDWKQAAGLPSLRREE